MIIKEEQSHYKHFTQIWKQLKMNYFFPIFVQQDIHEMNSQLEIIYLICPIIISAGANMHSLYVWVCEMFVFMCVCVFIALIYHLWADIARDTAQMNHLQT